MAALEVPGLPDGRWSLHNSAVLVYAALHFCEQPGTIDQFHAFMRDHLGITDFPPASTVGWLAQAVARGQGLPV